MRCCVHHIFIGLLVCYIIYTVWNYHLKSNWLPMRLWTTSETGHSKLNRQLEIFQDMNRTMLSWHVTPTNETDHPLTGSGYVESPAPFMVLQYQGWQILVVDQLNDIRLFNAWYDDRPSLLGPPIIRMFTVMSKALEHDIFSCLVWYESFTKPYISETWIRLLGSGHKDPTSPYRGNMISCRLPDSDVTPRYVSLVKTTLDTPTNLLKINYPSKPEVKRDFAVCMAVRYWKTDPLMIVEWVELLKLLGVTKLGIYGLQLENDALGAYKFYEREGFVEYGSMEWAIPLWPNTLNNKLHLMNICGKAALNSCVYRNMYQFKKIIVIDNDEIITPRKHRGYQEMVDYLETSTNSSGTGRSFVFRNAYFFTDFEFQVHSHSRLYTMRYQHRQNPNKRGRYVKSIIDPQACVRMHNHICWERTPGFRTSYKDMEVSPEIGLNQHYKNCTLIRKVFECDEDRKSVLFDNTTLRYQGELEGRVMSKLDNLGLQKAVK